MKKGLALLVFIASVTLTACSDQRIPESVASALATENGGTVVAKFAGYDMGLTNYTFLVCSRTEKVHIVQVFGKATEPQVHTTPFDVDLYCGSRSNFWKSYDEKARYNTAVKEELAKYKELFGFKEED